MVFAEGMWTILGSSITLFVKVGFLGLGVVVVVVVVVEEDVLVGLGEVVLVVVLDTVTVTLTGDFKGAIVAVIVPFITACLGLLLLPIRALVELLFDTTELVLLISFPPTGAIVLVDVILATEDGLSKVTDGTFLEVVAFTGTC